MPPLWATMDNIIHINNRNNPSLILAALLAGTLLLSLPTAVSAHGREGRDREKMSSLLQSLFEMKARRGETQTPEWNPGPIGTRTPDLEAPGAWSGPSVAAPLSHESPPSQPRTHFGLLRVSGAAAAKLPAPIIRSSSSGGGGAGERAKGRLATWRGEAEEGPAALDDSRRLLAGLDDSRRLSAAHNDDSPAGGVKHDFVRDLRRQFELRQQRAHASDE